MAPILWTALPFDEDVVDPAALTVHADLNLGSCQRVSSVITGELRALVGVLKISDLPCRSSDSCSAPAQKSVVVLTDTRRDSTSRLNDYVWAFLISLYLRSW